MMSFANEKVDYQMKMVRPLSEIYMINIYLINYICFASVKNDFDLLTVILFVSYY